MTPFCARKGTDVSNFYGITNRYVSNQRRLQGLTLSQHLASMVDTYSVNVIVQGVCEMMETLDIVIQIYADLPDRPPQILGHRDENGGEKAMIDISKEQLEMLIINRVPQVKIAELFRCSSKTIRRRILEYGLAPKGAPVRNVQVDAEGQLIERYSAGRSTLHSNIDNASLDHLILECYSQFPGFGRRLVNGYLSSCGVRVPRSRILESYQRVVGPTVVRFGNRRVQRRVYHVEGPNSLWHHDGQHGKPLFPSLES